MKPYRISFEEYLHAHKLVTRRTRMLLILMLGLVSMPFLFDLLLNLLQGEFDPALDIPNVAVPSVMIVFGLVYRARTLWALRRDYDARAALREETQLSFDDVGISTTSESGQGRLAWENVYRYLADPMVILVYEGPLIIRAIPCGSFESEQERQAFIAHLARARGRGA